MNEWVIEVYYNDKNEWMTWWEASSNGFMKPCELDWCIHLLAERFQYYPLRIDEYQFRNIHTKECIPAVVLGL